MNRYVTIYLIFLQSFMLLGQKGDKQWWLGLNGGINTTNISVIKSFQVHEFSNGTPASKNYDLKYRKGYQFGASLAWDFISHFGLCVQPQFSSYYFDYEVKNMWKSEDNSLEINDLHQHQLTSFQLPLILKFELPIKKIFSSKPKGGTHSKTGYTAQSINTNNRGNLLPYFQAGLWYQWNMAAQKTVERRELYNGFETNVINNELTIKPLMNTKNAAWLVGAGISYDLFSTIRFAVDADYVRHIDTWVSGKARRDNPNISYDYQDVMDDFKIQNWYFRGHIIFPLKYVYSRGYQAK